MTIQSIKNDRSGNLDLASRQDLRRSRIVDRINISGEASVEDLAQAFDASRETIRRDLGALDAAGVIRKFHGGGRIAGREANGEGPFAQRMLENVQAKRAIARAAATLFAEGTSLFIDAGSTTIFFAEALALVSGLTVITNSAAISSILARDGRHRVFTLGGAFREATSSCLGSMTVAQARSFTPDHAVLTVGALTDAGISDHDEDEAELARAMVEQARQLTALADHSKFGKAGLFPIAGIERVFRVVTESAPPAHIAGALQMNGVDVFVTDPQ